MATREELIRTPRSGARPLGGSDPSPGEAPRYARYSRSTSLGPSGSTAVSGSGGSPRTPPAARAAGGAAPARTAPSRSRSAGRTAQQFSAPEFREYQGIILAEFVLAELLVAATPIATRQANPGLSPYIPRDMVKMLSLGLVYFLLELLAVGSHGAGRFGAWFGGLILLTVGLNEAANIAKDLDIFGAQPKDKTAPQATGTTQAPGTTTAGGRG